MAPKDALQWLLIIGTILGGGIWLGKLQQQVTDSQHVETYYHGNVRVAEGK